MYEKSKNLVDNLRPIAILKVKLQIAEYHCVKSVQMQNFSGPYFLVFSPKIEKYWPEILCIWTLFTRCTETPDNDLQHINKVFGS